MKIMVKKMTTKIEKNEKKLKNGLFYNQINNYIR